VSFDGGRAAAPAHAFRVRRGAAAV